MAEFGQADTPAGNVEKGTKTVNVGTLSQGQKNRRRTNKKRDMERKEAATKASSGTDHLLEQAELLEETHRSPTNFTGTQDQVTPSKTPPLVGGGHA